MAPAWYMTIAVGLGLVAMFLMEESAPARKPTTAILAPAAA
jgi:hypothetical protein